ncbi:hypothetical protein LepocDRAFT_00004400 [Leptothrix ochracea L12]|uniref:Uncharacterized protein n=1 Tax=Leptothrix ochracea L12 TaxID=735332 RepID=I4Z661_9BURK|nr:hypothetical protein LepocDRAFT_00004400 [Leptothrix ochracea L12]
MTPLSKHPHQGLLSRNLLSRVIRLSIRFRIEISGDAIIKVVSGTVHRLFIHAFR